MTSSTFENDRSSNETQGRTATEQSDIDTGNDERKGDGSITAPIDTSVATKASTSSSTTAAKVTTTSKTAKNRPSTKKRRRKDMELGTQAERQLLLKQDRYDKLLYMAKKQLMKQAKQVRAFMVQRNIRKLKKQQQTKNNPNKDTDTTHKNDKKSDDKDNDTDDDDHNDEDDNNNDNTTSKGERGDDTDAVVQASLQPLKDLSLELVVHQAMRQLGLYHANPNPGTTIEPPKVLPPEQAKLVSSVLDHKRFQSSLEEWNEKVADFRRFCLLLNDRNNKCLQDTNMVVSRGGKKSKTKTTSLRPQDHQPTSYFCTSLNDNDEDDINNDNDLESDMMAYGPAATMTEDSSKPKNRRGQRARKAKALAIQAKKEGRQYESLNWREEKEKKANTSNDRDGTNNKDHEKKSFKKPNPSKHHPAVPPSSSTPKRVEETNKPITADLAAQHPSWAAKQQQKSGIVAFQGKKITFD